MTIETSTNVNTEYAALYLRTDLVHSFQHSFLCVWKQLQNPSQWPLSHCLLWHMRRSLFTVSAMNHIGEAESIALCLHPLM